MREIIGMMDATLERQLRESTAIPVATADESKGLELAITYVNGWCLTFMRCHNPRGERAYRLDDSLARVLGFDSVMRMRRVLPIQKSRRYLTIQSLRRAINRYGLRSMGLCELARTPPRKPKQTK